jgi:GNAT superfamily N-acetyltransferase
MRVVPLSLENASAWKELFDACASSCFCRYWHFEGNKNEWLARCAHNASRNRDEHLGWVKTGETAARGLIVMEEGLALGWTKLVPREAVGKLLRLPVYREENSTIPNAYVIGCLLVRPERRKQGVARALVQAADEHVHAWGGSAIEAYPRHFEGPLHDEEAWMGPEKVFVECGYAKVGGEGQYPVYRKMLNREAIV